MAGAKLALHDVGDAEAFAAAIVARSNLRLDWHDREDLCQFLLVEAWRLSERFQPGTGTVSFSTFAGTTLRRRITDWQRQRNGRTVWKFADRIYVRPRPELVSFDELDSLGDIDAGGSGDSATDCFASLSGLVAGGSSQTASDIRLIRKLVS